MSFVAAGVIGGGLIGGYIANSGNSGPQAPNYTDAAQLTANSAQQQNTAQTWANRPNISTPWGNSSWTSGQTIDPATGQAVTNWTNNVTLTPAQQQALEQQQQLQASRSTAAAGMMGRAVDAMGKPLDTSGLTGMFNPGGPAMLNTSGGPGGPQFSAYSGGADTANGVGQVGLQRGIDNNGRQIQTNVAGPGGYSDAATQAILQRQQPLQDRSRAALTTQLANQGIQQGSEAYTNAMRDQGMQENDANLAAITAGINQGNTEFSQGLQQGQFKNTAYGQQFDQGLKQGQFANDAAMNMFGQATTSAQIQNQAAQIQNQNRQFGVTTNNAAAQQAYQNANNQYLQGNASAAQQQGLNQDYSNMTMAQRQQQLAELMQQRNMPLNEMNAFLTGQQVQNPTFANAPNSTASRAPGTDYLTAAGMQGQANLNQYNAQTGQQNSMMNGLGSLASAWMMSDERVKDNIVPIGEVGGRGMFAFTYKGDDTPQVGFMAQEVEKTDPDAVAMGSDGYRRVNTARILQNIAREHHGR